MSKSLLGIKIAILVANGFDQQDFTETQKTLNAAGATLKVVSTDQGLVNGWEGTAWGHHFPVDQQLATALGADFDMLVVPGGQRSMDKLKTTAHTKRFLNSFMVSAKKVVLFGDAVGLMEFSGHGGDVTSFENVLAVADATEMSRVVPFMSAAEGDVQQAA